MVMKLSFSGLGEGLMARPRGLMVTVFTGDPELAMLEIMVTGARIPDTGELVRLRGVRQPSEFRLLIWRVLSIVNNMITLQTRVSSSGVMAIVILVSAQSNIICVCVSVCQFIVLAQIIRSIPRESDSRSLNYFVLFGTWTRRCVGSELDTIEGHRLF